MHQLPDLGVDFQPVKQVVQIGSPKNLARLLQRAGRSAHPPGGTSQVLFMPTNALELLELSAVRRGLSDGLVEQRKPQMAPLDVLLQHHQPGLRPGLTRKPATRPSAAQRPTPT